MNEHTVLYKQVIGPRGGKRFEQVDSITSGAFCITRPGVYKLTHFVNGFGSSRMLEITQSEIDRETREPGKVGPHGMGIEVH